MNRASAEDLIQENVTLPTLPQVVAKINSLVDDPDVGTREIGQVVSEDAPIAAKVLKIANSAYYGLRETVLSTEHASAVLGIRQLRNIAMQASVISQFDHLEGGDQFDIDELWRHSILTGQLCAAMSRRCRARIGLAPDEFHVVGLLHDMGKVLLLESMGDAYLAAVKESAESGRELFECEEESLGFNHAHVGSLIAAHWGLPAAVVNAIEHHHGPDAIAKNDPVANLLLHTNLMVHKVAEQDLDGAAAAFDQGTLRVLGLRPADIEECVELAVEALPHIEI
jgi:putative nucleotidyltransferase with HDIG domain